MRYPEFRAAGFALRRVLSKPAASCIGTRCKRTGMHWTVAGVDAIIALRCCKLSGRFEDFWERLNRSGRLTPRRQEAARLAAPSTYVVLPLPLAAAVEPPVLTILTYAARVREPVIAQKVGRRWLRDAATHLGWKRTGLAVIVRSVPLVRPLPWAQGDIFCAFVQVAS